MGANFWNTSSISVELYSSAIYWLFFCLCSMIFLSSAMILLRSFLLISSSCFFYSSVCSWLFFFFSWISLKFFCSFWICPSLNSLNFSFAFFSSLSFFFFSSSSFSCSSVFLSFFAMTLVFWLARNLAISSFFCFSRDSSFCFFFSLSSLVYSCSCSFFSITSFFFFSSSSFRYLRLRYFSDSILRSIHSCYFFFFSTSLTIFYSGL